LTNKALNKIPPESIILVVFGLLIFINIFISGANLVYAGLLLLLHFYYVFRVKNYLFSIIIGLAAVFIIGIFLKIVHWDGSGILIGVGLFFESLGFSALLIIEGIRNQRLGEMKWLVYLLALVNCLPVISAFLSVDQMPIFLDMEWIDWTLLFLSIYIFLSDNENVYPKGVTALIILIALKSGFVFMN
jgi:hypothetical protein